MKSGKFVSFGFIFVVLAGLLAGCGNDNAPANPSTTNSGTGAGASNNNGNGNGNSSTGGLLVGSGNSSSTATNNGPIVVTGKLGQTLTKGDYALTVSQVYRYADNDPDFPSALKVTNPDSTLLAVEMKIANNAANNPSGVLSSKGTNYGVSAEGRTRLKKSDGSYLEGYGGSFKTPAILHNDNLQPDAPAHGWITFTVPRSLNPADLRLEYKVPSSYYDAVKLDMTFVFSLQQ